MSFKISTSIPKFTLSDDSIKFLNILTKYGLSEISNALERNFCINNIPALTYVILKYDRILKNIPEYSSEHDFVKSFDIVNNFSTKVKQIVYFPIHVPNFNLLHIGSICHLNSCISMLSSLTELIKEMNETETEMNETEMIPMQMQTMNVHVSESFKILTQYLMNSYSQIDLNPALLFSLLSTLSINPDELEEATETMKKILRILYDNGVKKSTILYWDSTDEFSPNDLPLGTKINNINPKYLIVNPQDMNTVFNFETDKVNILDFNIPDGNSYVLTSIISFRFNHLVAAFSIGDEKFKIIDDLNNRYKEVIIDSKSLFSDKDSSHVLACYIRHER